MENELEKIKLDFDKGNGLIPTIVQDYYSEEILMLAYMSKESFMLTKKSKKTWFYSRSRNELWNKGETSGNFQEVKEIWTDCDYDTLIIKVKQNGVACHTGEKSCFFRRVF